MDTVEILINKGVDLNCLNLVSTKRISLKTYIYIYICLLVCIFHFNVYFTYVQRMQSPIHIAAEMGHTEICELLLASGANIEQREQVERLIPCDMEFFFHFVFFIFFFIFQSGRTPLYIAARGSFTAIVDMIIKTARLDYPTPVSSLFD